MRNSKFRNNYYEHFAFGGVAQQPQQQTQQPLQKAQGFVNNPLPQSNTAPQTPTSQMQVPAPAPQTPQTPQAAPPAAPAPAPVQKWAPEKSRNFRLTGENRNNANEFRDFYKIFQENRIADPDAVKSETYKKLEKYATGKKNIGDIHNALAKGIADKEITPEEINNWANSMDFLKTYKQSYADKDNAALAGDLNADWLEEVNKFKPDTSTELGKIIQGEINARLGTMSKKGQKPSAGWASGAGSGGNWVPTVDASGNHDYLYKTKEGNTYRYSDILNPNSEYMQLEKQIKDAGRNGDWGTANSLEAYKNATYPNFNPKAAKQAWKNQMPGVEMTSTIPSGAPKLRTRATGGGPEGQSTNWASNWGGFQNVPYEQQNSLLEGGANVFGGVGLDGKMYTPGTGGPFLDAQRYQNQLQNQTNTSGYQNWSNPYARQLASRSASPMSMKQGGLVKKYANGGLVKTNHVDGLAVRGKTKGKIV